MLPHLNSLAFLVRAAEMRSAAEIFSDELDAAGGIGGNKIRPRRFDGGIGGDKLLSEFWRLVQEEKVKVTMAAILKGLS